MTHPFTPRNPGDKQCEICGSTDVLDHTWSREIDGVHVVGNGP